MRLVSTIVRLAIIITLPLMLQVHIAAAEEGWPTKQALRIVIPFAAGGNGDVVGRVVAAYLGESLKGSIIVVENRPGSGGILGTRSFVKSPPDGYTLCICSGGPITVPSIVDKMYDPWMDLVPISRVNTSPLLLVVSAKSAMKSVADVVAFSKTKLGGLNYGSNGVGGLMYNAAEIFKSKTGAETTHVPFRGAVDALTALFSGEIDILFPMISEVIGPVEVKTLRPIAISTSTRSPLLPEVPTMIEQGVKDYDISLWNGLFAPRGVPQPIIDKLSEIMLRMPEDATVRRALTKIGSTPSVNTPDQFRKELREEAALWETGLKDVIRK
jgi:tripartite-type tricarboxylate transporter receptor subunit TctC